MEIITKNTKFWSDDDQQVLRAIREGFLETQRAMWKDLPNWRKTASGLPSTAGTTASICFIKRGKLFIGHVGDSGIVLGERDPNHMTRWRAKRLTVDHKPEAEPELSRIQEAGGKVVSKSGVPRVVWYRPSSGHTGPVRRSTHIDEVPFLAVARALGDLWSYNAKDDIYVVSPDPDLHVYDLNILKDRCLILATDGAWNVLSPEMTVQGVFEAERNNEKHMINPTPENAWINPSKKLVDMAVDRWNTCNLRADNTSVVTVMLDPPGPPRAQVLRRLHSNSLVPPPQQQQQSSQQQVSQNQDVAKKSDPGIAIISRYPNSRDNGQKHGQNLVAKGAGSNEPRSHSPITASSPGDNVPSLPPRIVHDSTKPAPLKLKPAPAVDVHDGGNNKKPVQCNEISSSDDESTPPPVPKRPAGGHPKNGLSANNNRGPRKSLNRELAALQASDDGGPSRRTRNQSGHHASVAALAPILKNRPPKPPLASRRSVVALNGNNEDSDCENNLPSARQTRKTVTASNTKRSRTSMASTTAAAKTPEISPRVLRSRNTPTPILKGVAEKRKRRSFEPGNLAAKMLKTAHQSASTSALKAVVTNSRSTRCLRNNK